MNVYLLILLAVIALAGVEFLNLFFQTRKKSWKKISKLYDNLFANANAVIDKASKPVPPMILLFLEALSECSSGPLLSFTVILALGKRNKSGPTDPDIVNAFDALTDVQKEHLGHAFAAAVLASSYHSAVFGWLLRRALRQSIDDENNFTRTRDYIWRRGDRFSNHATA